MSRAERPVRRLREQRHLRLLGRIAQESEFDQELHAILADEEHAVALVKTTAARGGKELKYDAVFVFHITGGKMTETWFTPVDHAAVEAFWAS
jgi:ketosteroid isomerase-like protein